MMIQAIETSYKGYRFRSRLEARWAVFFDALGIKWEYEKEGYHTPIGGYLPDFWLDDYRCFVEIKPDPKLSDVEIIKALYLSTSFDTYVLCGYPEVPNLRNGKVASGPFARLFRSPIGTDNKSWTEDMVIQLTMQNLEMVYPGGWVPLNNEGRMRDIVNKKGKVIGHVYREASYEGDVWRIYEMPMIQPDKNLLITTWGVQLETGCVVELESRPWLWHEWPDGYIKFWCYPEYVPKEINSDMMEMLKKGDINVFRGQQSVCKVNTERLRYAYTAARSARFEHGETPRIR